MKAILIISALYVSVLVTWTKADDITTVDGKTYKSAKVVSKDASTITIIYEDGGAKLAWDQLSDAAKKQYGYDDLHRQAQEIAAKEAVAKKQSDEEAEEQAAEASRLRSGKEVANELSKIQDSEDGFKGFKTTWLLFVTNIHNTTDFNGLPHASLICNVIAKGVDADHLMEVNYSDAKITGVANDEIRKGDLIECSFTCTGLMWEQQSDGTMIRTTEPLVTATKIVNHGTKIPDGLTR